MTNDAVAVILAAGEGRRMKSDIPKVLHSVLGRPMVEYVLDAVRAAGIRRVIVVVGHKADEVRSALAAQTDVEFALQAEQKGTGHAVRMCADLLGEHDGPVLVLSGDTPLLRAESLVSLLDEMNRCQAAAVIGTAETDANEGLGRIVRDAEGAFLRIVEQKDTTPEEAAIREINTGCYAFDGRLLFEALAGVRADNRQQEYYLTDCPGILLAGGHTVVAHRGFDIAEAMGVNTPDQLAAVERVLQERSRQSE